MPKVEVLKEYCKSYGLGVNICPKKILAIGDKLNQKGYYFVEVTDQGQCIGCGMCGVICPDLALEVYREGRK